MPVDGQIPLPPRPGGSGRPPRLELLRRRTLGRMMSSGEADRLPRVAERRPAWVRVDDSVRVHPDHGVGRLRDGAAGPRTRRRLRALLEMGGASALGERLRGSRSPLQRQSASWSGQITITGRVRPASAAGAGVAVSRRSRSVGRSGGRSRVAAMAAADPVALSGQRAAHLGVVFDDEDTQCLGQQALGATARGGRRSQATTAAAARARLGNHPMAGGGIGVSDEPPTAPCLSTVDRSFYPLIPAVNIAVYPLVCRRP